MTPDLIARMRLLVESDERNWVTAHREDLADLLDITDAAVMFGLACLELAAAERVAWNAEGGGTRLTAAEENHKATGERFAALCIPQEAEHG